MLQLSRWKVLLVVGATILSIIFSLPNALPAKVRESLPGWVPKQTLNLGLDLQGGSYLLLEVDLVALKNERLTNLIEDVRTTLRQDRIQFSNLGRAGDGVTVRITEPGQVEPARRRLSNLAQSLPNGGTDLIATTEPDQVVRLALSAQAMEQEGRQAVQQSIEIIRRRVDALGTREPSITQQGSTRIVVQAPGEADPERLKTVIGQTAKLTFQMVDDQVSAEEAAAGRMPPGSELLDSEEPGVGKMLVKRRALVTGEMLVSASPTYDQFNRPAIAFRFDSQGARRFADATAQNVNKRFAIILDKRVISAPTIQEPITGGSGQITGNFTLQQATDLALVLKSGALPAPLNVEEQRTVGAELGADAVSAGILATQLGLAIVVVFMIATYGWLFGGVSIIALAVNGAMIVAAMSMVQATLTLPGIAGMILTLAVAVDANVLIYERMREEIRAGRSLLMSMDAGFSRAMMTIMDANVTHLCSAVILFWFGAGPVRGFAWTLTIGVFTSVFTAVLVTQVLLALWLRLARPKKLPIV